MSKAIKCEICGSNIMIRRVDDGVTLVELLSDGSCKEHGSSSDGYTEVYCSKDKEHRISDEVREASILRFEKFELEGI